MNNKTRIALDVPDSKPPGKYFSFSLKNYLSYERSIYGMPSKMVVISDIEGNFRALKTLLVAASVIDKKYNWIFDDGHLVVLGDCFDRGDKVTECLWLIYSLEERAKKKGGYVHFILGNHEIMNMNGDWRYVHPKYSERNSSNNPFAALYDANNHLWKWICTKNIIEKIGDILFVHGGISSELLEFRLTIDDINNIARPFYFKGSNEFKDAFLNIVFNSVKSPFWFRGYYQDVIQIDTILDTLNFYDVNTIITGHTPVNTISSFYDYRVINVNTDHTKDNSEILLINRGEFYKINRNGDQYRIK